MRTRRRVACTNWMLSAYCQVSVTPKQPAVCKGDMMERIHEYRISRHMTKCMGPLCPPWNVTEMSWRQSVMVLLQDTLQLSSFVSSVSVRVASSIPSYWQPYPMLFAVMMVFQHVIGNAHSVGCLLGIKLHLSSFVIQFPTGICIERAKA